MSEEQVQVKVIPLTKSGAIWWKDNYWTMGNKIPFMINLTKDIEQFTIYEIDGIQLKEKQVTVYNYYCDLDGDSEWDDKIFWEDDYSVTNEQRKKQLEKRNMTGTGTKNDPWKNFSYALEKISCILKNTCCQYIRLVLSGTANYTASYYENNYRKQFYGDNRLIIDGGTFNIFRERKYNYGFFEINETFLYNQTINVNIVSERTCSAIAFYYCENCEFYKNILHVSVTTRSKTNNDGYCQGTGYWFSQKGNFIQCSATINVIDQTTGDQDTQGSTARGYFGCFYSNFYNCISNTNATYTQRHSGYHEAVRSFGYINCSNSTFNNCIGNNNGSIIYAKEGGYDICLVCRFYSNLNCEYYNCEQKGFCIANGHEEDVCHDCDEI